MAAAPPRFTLSPFHEDGDDDGGGYHPAQHPQHARHTNHKRPTATHTNNASRNTRRNTHPENTTNHHHPQTVPLNGIHGVDDPVLTSRRALGGAKMPASDLHNINQLFAFLAALVGVLLAVALVQGGVNNKPVAALIKLPGDLFVNALVCVIVPTIFLNSVLASMHFWTLNKAKALFYKLLAYFVLTTLWAAVLGMLVGVGAASLFQPHQFPPTTASNPLTVGKAAITLRCASNANATLVLGENGLRCEASSATNGTTFLLQDLSASFQVRDDPRLVVSLADAMVILLECFFPANGVQAFLKGDVISVIIIGTALGIALIHKSPVRTRELLTPGFSTRGGFEAATGADGSPFSGQFFLLIMQSEVMLSVVLKALLKVLPFALVPIVAGGILEAHTIAPSNRAPSIQDLATLAGVVIVALLIQLASILAVTFFLTKTNPFTYVKHLFPAQLVAMASSSSLVALPSTVRSIAASKQVSMPLAHFVCSSGLALNKNGSALYLSVASMYVLVASGSRDVATQPVNLVLLTVVSMLCSFVLPPMPRGNLAFVSTILWSVFGVHDTTRLAQMVLFLSAMDWLLDPFVTAVNVTNNSLIALILAVQMDETFIEFGRFDAVSDTQEEDSNDGFPLDDNNDRPVGAHPHAGGPRQGPGGGMAHENYQNYHTPTQRDRAGTHGSGTMRPPLIARMTSVGESVVSV